MDSTSRDIFLINLLFASSALTSFANQDAFFPMLSKKMFYKIDLRSSIIFVSIIADIKLKQATALLLYTLPGVASTTHFNSLTLSHFKATGGSGGQKTCEVILKDFIEMNKMLKTA